ncbi:hypothetical protein [Demequina aestuarii]|uniref:hypothetical protein n=1 Tax=Demequina aestuarii TaxID=327095 RepID=UPI0007813C3E|nr:hypothetical protein [Demequina aestuarii]
MSEAREAFHDLHGLAGAGFDGTGLADGPERVERRVARWRDARAALASVAGIAVVAMMAVGLNSSPAVVPLPGSPVEPPVTASAMPAPGVSMGGTDPSPCAEATVVPGKAIGNFGGLMGWFSDTPSAPCDEWDQQILDHPDTVLIYTADNTMVEAYYRTSIDALGPYADLGPDFEVPTPDPDWPENMVVLIDAKTGEVLLVQEVPETFGDAEGGATELSDRLVGDRDALADRLEGLARGGEAPDGFQIDAEATGPGTEADLADPLVFVPADHPLSEDLPTIVARLVRGDQTAAPSPEAEALETGLPVAGAVLFDVMEPGDMAARTMQLGVPIGDDATLVVVGTGDSADQYLIELVAWHLLAE